MEQLVWSENWENGLLLGEKKTGMNEIKIVCK